jgi:6-phosphogluconolactonase
MVRNLMPKDPIIHDHGDMVENASIAIEAALREALNTRDTASLIVSGGSSPKPLYAKLSKADLDWSMVTVSLVDERWVDPGQVGSNADFIQENLIQNNASAAKFFGLKTAHPSTEAGLRDAEARFASVDQPFDVCVMGMGGDAHTASWFPNSKGLSNALNLENDNILCAIDAAGAPVAGDYPHRISLTLSAVLNSHLIILFIPGETKREVFNSVASKPLLDAPVQALLQAGQKLHVFASPKL